jgi:hypothetical protein
MNSTQFHTKIRAMNKKLVAYGLIGVLTGGAVIGCSITNSRAQQGHNANDMEMPGMSHESSGTQISSPNEHSMHGMEMPQATATAQATLSVPESIVSNQSVLLSIEVQDLNGEAINDFATFQEKLMHLIVVSDDLQVFHHIHPTYRGNGRFEVNESFPQSGQYTLFSDYKPAGGSENVSVLKVSVPGTAPVAPAIDLSRTKTIASTKVDLSVPATISAQQEVTLTFNLKDATTNQAIAVQPYLGEQGHLVVVRQTEALTRTDYIHAHALRNTPAGQVSFVTQFPRTGMYKLWGQFNRNGEIVIADFWVNVQ